MNTRTLIRHSLTLAFALTVTTGAFAEPARAGYRNSIARTQCSAEEALDSTGYRGSRARPAVDRVHAGAVASGYRATLARTEPRQVKHQVAIVVTGRSCVN